jgi:hypothetical protein
LGADAFGIVAAGFGMPELGHTLFTKEFTHTSAQQDQHNST